MTDQAFHVTFLDFGHQRYLKLALVVCVLALAAFFFEPSELRAFGGSRVGLILGTVGAGLILWLMWFGIRKRSYRSRMGTVQGWLSAHVYLGMSLVVVATLHTGFQAGWNVHTLAYVLMMMVVVSGLYGVYAYVRYPTRITDAMGDETLETILLKVASLDMEARKLALSLSDEINAAVLLSSQKTRVGGGAIAQLRGVDPDCPTSAAVRLVRAKVGTFRGVETKRGQELYAVLVRKEGLLDRARQSVMYKARLDIWLYAHVPLSFALLAALAAHILSVYLFV
ncbi:MAG: hypothetical protein ABI672_03125 [Vicinamibacteria bacterium]